MADPKDDRNSIQKAILTDADRRAFELSRKYREKVAELAQREQAEADKGKS